MFVSECCESLSVGKIGGGGTSRSIISRIAAVTARISWGF
jgi:hypothetical protein